jgi:hypothetical protein
MGRAAGSKARARDNSAALREHLAQKNAGVADLAGLTSEQGDAAREYYERAVNDEDLQARCRADAPEQARRLRAAGWRRAFEGTAGLGSWGHAGKDLKMIHSLHREDGGALWAHVSLSFYCDRGRLPGWYALRDLHWLLYPGDFGVQVVAPPSRHRSIAEVAHVFTRLDAPAVPDFGRFGGV